MQIYHTRKTEKTGWEINLNGQISDINEKSGQQKKQISDKDKSIEHPPTVRLEPTTTRLRARLYNQWLS
jgi:hypothetical protein